MISPSASPEKKRMKCESNRVEQDTANAKDSKRLRSQVKTELELEKEIQNLRKKNFVTACEKVSCEAYLNLQKRLQIVNLPVCAKTGCNHSFKHETAIREMPPYAKESFNIEVKSGMWYDALEVCQVSITYDQYLPAEVLKEIIEIIMNVQDDIYVNYTVEELIDKCQQVLAFNFNAHPPCPMLLRKCYKNFLTSPMDLKQNTCTIREKFDCSEGIVKYCMDRLEADLQAGSVDGPLINIKEITPQEMDGIRGLHWQKEKTELFEFLERQDRIIRCMAVLESILELLQSDLAIWQKRYTKNMGRHMMEVKNRPLLAVLLWPTCVYNTGGVTKNCQQVIDLFINFIHLQYPDEHIQIMTTFLNTIIQTLYICETNSNSDYPNLGTYCNSFAKKFYESMTCSKKDLSTDAVISILEKIQPSFMRHLVGMHVTKSFLELDAKKDIISILIDFIIKCQEQEYEESECDMNTVTERCSLPIDTDNMLLHLMMQCTLEKDNTHTNSDNNNNLFPKFVPYEPNQSEVRLNHIVHGLYITFNSYLDCYSVPTVQETLDDLNEKLQQHMAALPVHIDMPKPGMYSVSEDYIKKYRTIYKKLQELVGTKPVEGWPKVLEVLNNISILG